MQADLYASDGMMGESLRDDMEDGRGQPDFERMDEESPSAPPPQSSKQSSVRVSSQKGQSSKSGQV